MRLIIYLILYTCLLSGCKFGRGNVGDESGSNLASVDLNLPDLASNDRVPKSVAEAIHAYSLKITPQGCMAGAKVVDTIQELRTNKINSVLTPGCSYNFELKMGGLAMVGGDSELLPVYYEGSKSLSASEVRAGKITVQIILSPTKIAIDGGAPTDPIATTDSPDTDATLEAIIGGPAGQVPASAGQSDENDSGTAFQCKNPNQIWASELGGCHNRRHGIIFSRLADFNGTFVRMSYSEGMARCSGLNEGGVSGWRLMTEDEAELVLVDSPGPQFESHLDVSRNTTGSALPATLGSYDYLDGYWLNGGSKTLGYSAWGNLFLKSHEESTAFVRCIRRP